MEPDCEDDPMPTVDDIRAMSLQLAIHVLGPGMGKSKSYVDCAKDFENYVRGMVSVPATVTKISAVKAD